MAEVSNYNLSIERYSHTEKTVRDFRKELNFEVSTIRDVANHSQILEVNPKLPAITTLFGINKTSSWAKFSPPSSYHVQRKKSLYIIPSLGGPDKQDIDIQKIKSFLDILSTEINNSSNLRMTRYKNKKIDSKEEQNEKDKNPRNSEDDKEETIEDIQSNSKNMKLVNQGLVLIKVLDEGIKSTNIMIDYIISRIFQFVQG